MARSATPPTLRSKLNTNPIISAIYYVCSLLAMTPDDMLDSRPHLQGTLEGSDTNFLINTGAAISCISEEKFRSLANHWALEEAPPDAQLRLASASGHSIQIVGRYYFDINFQGRRIRRPIYVLRGLARHKAILGMDFVKEQHLTIDGSGTHFDQAACLLYTSPSPRDLSTSRMPSSA